MDHGQGIGEMVIRRMACLIFIQYPHAFWIEGRQNNHLMRKVFHKCAFVKEACHRHAWPSKESKLYDSMGYVTTQEDWEDHKRTPMYGVIESFDTASRKW